MDKIAYGRKAAIYARFRPTYPVALFKFLSTLVPYTSQVWDCGTGNGQAATVLANYFQKVVATDASLNQVTQARAHERLTYCVTAAENACFSLHSIDLITTANALHWFRLDTFYQEVNRVLKPSGYLACWAYKFPQVSPEIDAILHHYDQNIVGFPDCMRWVHEAYRTIPFPFRRVNTPSFIISLSWTLDDLLGYLHTWSTTIVYTEKNDTNPVDFIKPDLMKSWGGNAPRTVLFPLALLVGQNAL